MLNNKPIQLNKIWFWPLATLACFFLSDFMLRVASVQVHFAIGTFLQAIPLFIVTTLFILYRAKKTTSLKQVWIQFWPLLVTYGVIQFFLGNILFYVSLQLGGLSIASPSIQSQAIWAVLIGAIFLREKINSQIIMGIGMFIVGIVTLAWFQAMGAELKDGWIWGIVVGIVGGLAWSTASAIQRYLLQSEVPLTLILSIGTFIGMLLLNLLTVIYYGPSLWTEMNLIGALKVLAAGCFYGLAIYCLSQSIKRMPISKVIPVISLTIVINTITASIWLGEYISIGSALGMLLTFLGVLMVQEVNLSHLLKKYQKREVGG